DGRRVQVHAGGERPAQVGFVLAGQRGGAARDARQADALVVGDLPADHDGGADPGAGLAGHVKLDVAVVDEDPVARFDVVHKALVGGGPLTVRAGDVIGGD